MLSTMGRPKEHDARTAVALVDAAERMVDAGGLGALSVRGVAEEVGTTTRAVYSLFGSKEALFVALGTRAFEMLGAAIAAQVETDDPAADLAESGVEVFRRFAIEHPSLFRIGIQLALPRLRSEFGAPVAESFAGLQAKVKRVKDAGQLGGRTVRDAAMEFHALCEGLSAVELRGLMPPGQETRIWRDALTALVAGFATTAAQGRRRRPTS
ncbi:MAG: TetR/AcrR family transcriptional regulator [Acidimicrobiales bacterium]